MKNWLDRQTCHELDLQSWKSRWDDCCDDDRIDRKMFRGDTLVFNVQVLKPAPGSIGACPPLVPVDLSLYTMWFTAKYNLPDVDQQAVVQLTSVTSGIAFTVPSAGMATITMPARATLFFADGLTKLLYDVQVADPSGVVSTVEFGRILVFPDVTRAIPGGLFVPTTPSAPVLNGSNSLYAVKPGDVLVEFDGRDGLQGSAVLGTPNLGELHTFAQPYWLPTTPPPLITAASAIVQPYNPSSSSGTFVASTGITDLGGRVTYRGDGAKWIVIG